MIDHLARSILVDKRQTICLMLSNDLASIIVSQEARKALMAAEERLWCILEHIWSVGCTQDIVGRLGCGHTTHLLSMRDAQVF